jgi:hypothetical protein
MENALFPRPHYMDGFFQETRLVVERTIKGRINRQARPLMCPPWPLDFSFSIRMNGFPCGTSGRQG